MEERKKKRRYDVNKDINFKNNNMEVDKDVNKLTLHDTHTMISSVESQKGIKTVQWC